MSANSTQYWMGVARWKRLATLLLFCGSLLACGKGSEEPGDDGVLLGILVSPQDAIVPLGGDVQLYATGLYDDRSSRDLTAVVEWRSTEPSVVEVSNSLDKEGVLIGSGAGQAEVAAFLGGVASVPVRVTVTTAELVGLDIEPNEISLEKGQTLQLVAKASYSDGTRGDASTQVRWVTSDGTVATLERSGLLEAVGQGSAEIHAILDETSSAMVPVSVINAGEPDLYIEDLSLEAADDGFTASVRVGNKGTAAATGFFLDLFLNPSQTPKSGDYGDDYTTLEYVAPGESVSATFSFQVSDGTHQLVAAVDLDNWVPELSENNNSKQAEVVVGGQSTVGPNLTISYFDYAVYNDTVYYFVDITNTGGEDVGPFFVDLFYDSISPPALYDDGDEWTKVEALAAGETAYADFIVSSSDLEEVCSFCWSWLMVDGYDNVSETNEDDNVEGSLTVSY